MSTSCPLPKIVGLLPLPDGSIQRIWSAAGPLGKLRIDQMTEAQRTAALDAYYASCDITPPKREQPVILNQNHRLVRRARKLLADLAAADLAFSLGSPGGQPLAFIHAAARSIERDSDHAECLGSKGVGEMIAW